MEGRKGIGKTRTQWKNQSIRRKRLTAMFQGVTSMMDGQEREERLSELEERKGMEETRETRLPFICLDVVHVWMMVCAL